MLNIDVNRSAEGVEQYFDCELAVSDYLMKEPGIWAGRGAERLGLRGPVQRSHLVALLRNENPRTGKRLTARTNTSRREDGVHTASRGMNSVFLRNGIYAAHVGLWLRPLLCYFGEESFKSGGSDIDEHSDRLIRFIFESVD